MQSLYRSLPALLVVALVVPLGATPPAVADHAYDQPVWFKWNTTELDVLVVGVEDPLIGAAIRRSAAAWETGIQQLAADWLRDTHVIRLYLSGLDPLPPEGFEAHDVDIYVFPQGFFAINHGNPPGPNSQLCTAHAPVAVLGAYATASHELGHCLGLHHVFNHGDEYAPSFDIMGSGSVSGGACPSNLNIQVLERVYGHLFGLPAGGSVTMSASEYMQSDC